MDMTTFYELTGAQVFTGVMTEDAVDIVASRVQLIRFELLYKSRISINTINQHHRE